jgi:flagellar biosynthesis protein FliR
MLQRARPAARRYLARYAGAMVAYVLLLVIVPRLVSEGVPAPARWLLAVVPALPILAVIWALGRFLVEENDEMLRAMMVEQLLWGAAVSMAVATLWGFLEAIAGAPHIRAYWVFPVYCLAMAVALPFVNRKYS